MLYKFKSKGTGDLIMLQPNGRRMLEIIGKANPDDAEGATAKGIIEPQQMPAAVAAITAAIDKEEAEQRAVVAHALAHNEPAPRFDAISLRQRSLPFIEMMRRCEKAGYPIVWGV